MALRGISQALGMGQCFSSIPAYTGWQTGCRASHCFPHPLQALLSEGWLRVETQLGEFLKEASSSGSPMCVPRFLLKVTQITIYPQSKKFYGYG